MVGTPSFDQVSQKSRGGFVWNWILPGTPNNQFLHGCFNWKIPNHYTKNGCFTKQPLKNGCLGYQVYIIIHPHPLAYPHAVSRLGLTVGLSQPPRRNLQRVGGTCKTPWFGDSVGAPFRCRCRCLEGEAWEDGMVGRFPLLMKSHPSIQASHGIKNIGSAVFFKEKHVFVQTMVKEGYNFYVWIFRWD